MSEGNTRSPCRVGLGGWGVAPFRYCFWRPRVGETRPAGVSVGGGDDGLPRVGKMLSSPDVARWGGGGGSSSVGTANPVGSDGPVVAGGPVGLCETLSPLFHDALGPLEHSVPDETILGLDPLEHSGLDHAGPVGRHVAGGPVGPDETLLGLDPLEHSGLDHAETILGLDLLEHSSLDHAGPVGRYVAGALLARTRRYWVWIH